VIRKASGKASYPASPYIKQHEVMSVVVKHQKCLNVRQTRQTVATVMNPRRNFAGGSIVELSKVVRTQ